VSDVLVGALVRCSCCGPLGSIEAVGYREARERCQALLVEHVGHCSVSVSYVYEGDQVPLPMRW
jgi:hypothetical protein